MTDNILQEQEWEEYDSQLHDAGSEHGSLALASSSEEAASTGMAGGPFLLDRESEAEMETEQAMETEVQEMTAGETERPEWSTETSEFDLYAEIRPAMAPQHARLSADEITVNLGRLPAAIVLHQHLNSEQLRQAARANLLGNAGRRYVRVNGSVLRVPVYLRMLGRLCREVADHAEAEFQSEQETLAEAETQALSGSVGRGGVNRPEDVRLIQRLINANLPVPLAPLAEDGTCGPKTIFAIETYQQRVLGMSPPDGRVDPGGATFRSLTGGGVPMKPAPSPGGKGAAGNFPPDVISAAQASHSRWNIPASVTLAQWAVESNWGRAIPSGSNNPFGIKASAGQPYVEARTREVIKGQDIYVTAKFRKFDSINDAFDQHGKLLATAKPYARARTFANDPDAFADTLTGVYATDPRYGVVLKNVMKKVQPVSIRLRRISGQGPKNTMKCG